MNPNPPPDRRAPGPHVAPDRPVAFVPRDVADVYAARRAALAQAMEAVAKRAKERERAR